MRVGHATRRSNARRGRVHIDTKVVGVVSPYFHIIKKRSSHVQRGRNLARKKEPRAMKRQCGGCSLCCKSLPVPPLRKPAGKSCDYQKFRKGCAVYRSASMPPECRLWSCRWLVNDDAAELSRPDRSHYVIDVMPDYISLRDNTTGELINIQVVQIWVDPRHRDAHRDAALRRWLQRRAEQGIAALIRFNSRDAVALFAPPSTPMAIGTRWAASLITEPTRSVTSCKRSEKRQQKWKG